jgi:hypothetical protein
VKELIEYGMRFIYCTLYISFVHVAHFFTATQLLDALQQIRDNREKERRRLSSNVGGSCYLHSEKDVSLAVRACS